MRTDVFSFRILIGSLLGIAVVTACAAPVAPPTDEPSETPRVRRASKTPAPVVSATPEPGALETPDPARTANPDTVVDNKPASDAVATAPAASTPVVAVPPASPAVTASGSVTASPTVTASPAITPTPTPLLVTTLAGTGEPGRLDGPGAAAQFDTPTAMAILDSNPSPRFVLADTGNHLIRRVSPGGVVETLAGDGSPDATDHATSPLQASFNRPEGLAVATDAIYVADTGNHRIRRIRYLNGIAGGVETIAGTNSGFSDGAGQSAQFSAPRGLALDATRQRLYVADTLNRRIRVINLSDPTFPVTTVAGTGEPGANDGSGNAATFFQPVSLTWDGFLLYVIDRVDARIRTVTPGDGGAATALVNEYLGSVDPGFADGGQGVGRFDFTAAGGGIFIGPTFNLIIADSGNQRIRIHTDTLGTVTAAGTGARGGTEPSTTSVVGGFRDGPAVAGPAEQRAQFNNPVSIVYVADAPGASGTIYVTDSGNHRLRRVQVGPLRNPMAN